MGGYLRKNFPGQGNCDCKEPDAGACLVCWRSSREGTGVRQSE